MKGILYSIFSQVSNFNMTTNSKEIKTKPYTFKKNLLSLSGLHCFFFWTISFVEQRLVNISPDLISDFSGSFKLESFKVTQRSTLKNIK